MPAEPPPVEVKPEASESDSDSDIEMVHETDQERRRTMLNSMMGGDLASVKASMVDYGKGFVLPSGPMATPRTVTGGGAVGTDSPFTQTFKGKGRAAGDEDIISISSGDEDGGTSGRFMKKAAPRPRSQGKAGKLTLPFALS